MNSFVIPQLSKVTEKNHESNIKTPFMNSHDQTSSQRPSQRILPKNFLKDIGAEKKSKERQDILSKSKLSILDDNKYIEPSRASPRMAKRQIKKLRKTEREKTKGSAWFHMGAPELTVERKNDLEALRLRGALDTKRFYKRNNITSLPKYFQVGRVVDSPEDFYSSRLTKKERKKGLAEEMVAEIDE